LASHLTQQGGEVGLPLPSWSLEHINIQFAPAQFTLLKNVPQPSGERAIVEGWEKSVDSLREIDIYVLNWLESSWRVVTIRDFAQRDGRAGAPVDPRLNLGDRQTRRIALAARSVSIAVKARK
jgi:hypothetical protein